MDQISQLYSYPSVYKIQCPGYTEAKYVVTGRILNIHLSIHPLYNLAADIRSRISGQFDIRPPHSLWCDVLLVDSMQRRNSDNFLNSFLSLIKLKRNQFFATGDRDDPQYMV